MEHTLNVKENSSDSEMKQTLELIDKDFKGTVIIIFNELAQACFH